VFDTETQKVACESIIQATGEKIKYFQEKTFFAHCIFLRTVANNTCVKIKRGG